MSDHNYERPILPKTLQGLMIRNLRRKLEQLEQIEQEAYLRGGYEGYKIGREVGYDAGYNKGYADALGRRHSSTEG